MGPGSPMRWEGRKCAEGGMVREPRTLTARSGTGTEGSATQSGQQGGSERNVLSKTSPWFDWCVFKTAKVGRGLNRQIGSWKVRSHLKVKSAQRENLDTLWQVFVFFQHCFLVANIISISQEPPNSAHSATFVFPMFGSTVISNAFTHLFLPLLLVTKTEQSCRRSCRRSWVKISRTAKCGFVHEPSNMWFLYGLYHNGLCILPGSGFSGFKGYFFFFLPELVFLFLSWFCGISGKGSVLPPTRAPRLSSSDSTDVK